MAPPHAPALFSDTYPVLVEEKHTGDKNVRLPILGREENKELFGILKEPTETKGEEIFPSVEEDMIETLRKQQNRDNKIEENDATCFSRQRRWNGRDGRTNGICNPTKSDVEEKPEEEE